MLASPNGATCSHYGRSVSHLLVGSLLNAQAVADAVASLLAVEEQRAVSVIACGERWHEPSEDGTLRFALEDYLGAGAILSSLDTFSQSPEARVCVGAFRQAREQLPELLQGSYSGQELIQAGFPQDVEHAARLDLYRCVPVMREGFLEQL